MSQKRQNFSSGGKWEPVVGYSRAVRVGNMVFVAGTTAADQNGNVVGDAYEQTKRTLENIGAALKMAGADFKDVVRTRMFVKNIADSEMIGRAHGEVFKNILPVASMIEVSGFMSLDMLIEIEVDALTSES